MQNAIPEIRKKRLEIFKSARVYPVVSSEFCSREPVETVESLLAAGTRLVQLREKAMSDRKFFEYVRACKKIAGKYGALLIVDDRADIALAADADGVHLGQDDLDVPAARAIAPALLIGVSTHNARELAAAQKTDCDYLNVGPIFPTQTKAVSYPAVGLDELSRLIPQIKIPFSVMGGIKAGHVPELRSRGVPLIAAVTAFTRADDIAGAVRAFS